MQQTVLWLQTWTAAIVLLVLAATFIVGLVLRTTADRIPRFATSSSLTSAYCSPERVRGCGGCSGRETEQRDGSGQSSAWVPAGRVKKQSD
jgi:hypothetical protein